MFKLLVSCPDINKVYVLLRSKNHSSATERLTSMLNTMPFTLLDKNDAKKKIIALEGDVIKPYLGISIKDRIAIVDNVSLVFHCAASIRFDEPLKNSLDNNVLATKHIIDLCKQFKQIHAFIHCSTAYSNCHMTEVEERFYNLQTSPSKIIKLSEWLSEDCLNLLAPHLIEGRPNIYTYTKALAEQLIQEECQLIPTVVVRPSIVANAHSEPVPGWIDTLHGAPGLIILGILGFLRAVNWNHYAKADFVPVDKVANAMIAVAWATGTDRNVENPKIFNITTTNDNTITWGGLLDIICKTAIKAPSMRTVRRVITLPKQNRPNPILYPLKKFFSQLLFSYLLDSISMLFGRKRIMVVMTKKMDYVSDMLKYFTQHEWTFKCNNLMALNNRLDDEDRKQFDFDMSVLDWQVYIKNCHYGNRRYLLKETDDTIPMAVKRLKIIHMAYTMFKILMAIIIAFLISYPIFLLFISMGNCVLCHYYILYIPSIFVTAIIFFYV